MLRIVIPAAGVAIVVAMGLAIDSRSRAPAEVSQADPAKYRIFAPGRVEGVTPEIELRPQTGGRVVAIAVSEGEFVQPGAVLMRLDDQVQRHEVALAASELERAKAQFERLENGARAEERAEAEALYRARLADMERARKKWNRIVKLRQANAVTQHELDEQQALVESLSSQAQAAQARLELVQAPARRDELRIARASVAAAKARWELARAQLKKTVLVAPSRGPVLQIHPQVGELAGPEDLFPSIILADTSGLRVRAFVEELDAPRVRRGMNAQVQADGLPNHPFEGHVQRISPRMGAKRLWSDRAREKLDTKIREVWIELDQSDGLVVGLRVDVTIDPESAE